MLTICQKISSTFYRIYNFYFLNFLKNKSYENKLNNFKYKSFENRSFIKLRVILYNTLKSIFMNVVFHQLKNDSKS